MRDPAERLRDMLEAIAAIERYLNRGKEGLEEDELLQCWFVHHFQIIGEAARALPEEVRGLAPEMEWHKIIGMKNVLVHGYFAIDTEIVWKTVSQDVPRLKPTLKKLLKKLERHRG